MTSALPDMLARALESLPAGGLVVGCSGGLDSSVLLHALAMLPAARERGLRVVHVDHGLHADSAHWASQVTRTALALDLPCRVMRVDVDLAGGTGLEAAARSARYAAFASTLQPGETLVLAHHADDQTETLLLKLLRGAGPEGLGGMRVLRPFASGQLWRPLLGVARAALRAYASAHALAWIEDPGNAQMHLDRNFLRAQLLPMLRTRWPNADVALAHSARWLRDSDDYVDAAARRALAQLQGLDPQTLAWAGWLALPDALRDRVLRLWLRALGLDEPAHFHVRELARQLADARADRLPCVSFACTELRRYRGLLYALRPAPGVPPQWQADWHGEALSLPGGAALRFDGSTRLPTLRLRHRRQGERLRPAGSTHSRPLRLLLQEAGVPPWLRDALPLIEHDGQLLGVADLVLTDAGLALCEAHGGRFAWDAPSLSSPLRAPGAH